MLFNQPQPPFYQFLREERQFCAVLAHLLMQKGGNLRAFIELLNSRPAMSAAMPLGRLDEAEIYIEFAYLRDLWDGFGAGPGRSRAEANDLKRNFLREAFKRLGISDAVSVHLSLPLEEMNRKFAPRQAIKFDIASPHHWEVAGLHALEISHTDFTLLCKLKWSFNIKPDLVILVPGSSPLCIEAKLESREGFYPRSKLEVAPFADRAVPRIRQFELQEFMFRELLQMPAQHVVVAKNIPQGTQGADADAPPTPVVTWVEALSRMDMGGSIPFVKKLFDENRTIRAHGPAPAKLTATPPALLKGESP